MPGGGVGRSPETAPFAPGTFDSNSRHNAIEEAVAKEMHSASAADPVTYEVSATLIPGTEIATHFECKVKRPSRNGGAWVVFDPIDTLSTNKEDRAEDTLLRHAQHSFLSKS